MLDASAALELLLRRRAFERVADRVLAWGEVLHVPHLFDVEIAHTLRRLEMAGTLESERAREALHDLGALRLIRHAHTDLLDRVWALRRNLTAYDAMYIALAEALDAPLLTMDGRLAAAPGHQASVELL